MAYGAGKRKTKRNRTILPRLRKVSYKNKKHRYRLKDPFRKRKKAIHEGVKMEAEMKGRSIKKAAIAKKGRFNVLRIYRRNKKIKECNTITHDMRYMDKKYGLGKTKNICGQKGGTNESLLNPAQSTFRNLQELKAILNFYNSNKIIFKSWNGDETEHELKPEQDSNTHLLIVGADYGIPFTLLENPNSDKIKPKGYVNYLTYVSAQQGGARKKKGGRSTASGYNAFQPPPPLVSGNYIRIGTGEVVNIIDTTSTADTQEVDYVAHTLQSPITGVIIGQAGPPFSEYYHMIVTRGNSEIPTGTSVHLHMDQYNANTHVPITRNYETSNEEKDNQDTGNGPAMTNNIPT